MQILITSSGATPFILADDNVATITTTTWPNGAGGQIKEGFVNKQNRTVQRSPLLRAAYSIVFPRYNLENHLAFTVQREFATVESCISFIALHPDSVPTQGEITLDNQSATGRIYRYLPNAVVEKIACVKHVGTSCDFQYEVSGNGPWQTTP